MKRSSAKKINELMKRYTEYTKAKKIVLVGHPCIEEVRSAPLSEFSEYYTKDNIGLIKPTESRWWKAIAEFMGLELPADFPLPIEAQDYYYFGNYNL